MSQLSPEARRARALEVAKDLSGGRENDPNDTEDEESSEWDFTSEQDEGEAAEKAQGEGEPAEKAQGEGGAAGPHESEAAQPLKVGTMVLAKISVVINGDEVVVPVRGRIGSLWKDELHCSLHIPRLPLSQVEPITEPRKRAPKRAPKRKKAAELDHDEPLGHKKPKPEQTPTPQGASAATSPKTPKPGKEAVARIAVLPPKCTPEQAEQMVRLADQIGNAPLFVAAPEHTPIPPGLEQHTQIPFVSVTNSGAKRPCLRRILAEVATRLGVAPSDLLCALVYTDAATDAELPTRQNVQLIHPAVVAQYGELATTKLAKIAASQAYASLPGASTAAPAAKAASPIIDLTLDE